MTPGEKPGRRTLLYVAAGFALLFAGMEAVLLPSPWTVTALRGAGPELTALMKERIDQARESRRPYRIVHTFVPLSRISDSLVHAVIVAEDGTFYEHGGVDWYEVRQSLLDDWRHGRIVRGSSTITMQLAKNLWFSTSRDPLTKLNEVISAYMLEHYLTKNRILELYLNDIEFGRGIFGVEAASRYYFGKPASGLSREEAARLAAIIPSPIRHQPNSDSRFVSDRLGLILLRMEARGW